MNTRNFNRLQARINEMEGIRTLVGYFCWHLIPGHKRPSPTVGDQKIICQALDVAPLDADSILHGKYGGKTFFGGDPLSSMVKFWRNELEGKDPFGGKRLTPAEQIQQAFAEEGE